MLHGGLGAWLVRPSRVSLCRLRAPLSPPCIIDFLSLRAATDTRHLCGSQTAFRRWTLGREPPPCI